MIARFVDHKYIFDLEGARSAYLGYFERALEGHDAEPLAYSQMSSHLHWSLVCGGMPLGDLFHRAHGGFAEWVRDKVGGIGSVFAGRFKNITFEPELTGILISYIHNNETRANLVPGPAQSRWSSHRYYRGDAKPPPWLRVDKGLELSGFDASPVGRAQFDAFVESRAGDPRMDVMTETCALEDRLMALQELPRAETFVPTLSSIQPKARRPASTSRAWRGEVESFIEVACELSGASRTDLQSGSRKSPLPETRSALFLAWKDKLGRPLRELADVLRVKPSTASATFVRARANPRCLVLADAIASTCLTRAS